MPSAPTTFIEMKNTDTLVPPNKFSYEIHFRHKKFDEDLKATVFMNSILLATVDEPVPDHMQRNWLSIIQEINPSYFQIEIINVKNFKE
jgi:hypothetical protein